MPTFDGFLCRVFDGFAGCERLSGSRLISTNATAHPNYFELVHCLYPSVCAMSLLKSLL
eukprot:COSAG03_NODE_1178_length_4640_cov_47.734420_4_plen_59_part_00